MCSSVLLPDPDGPMIATNSPSSTRASTPRRAWTAPAPSPNTFATPRASRAGACRSVVMRRPYARSARPPSAVSAPDDAANYGSSTGRRPYRCVMSSSTDPFRVLIAGGGVAGLEAALALRDLAGDRVAVTLLAPGPDFVYRPFA